jgi:hypothetical protein
MTANGWLQIAIYCLVATALVKPFGGYMTHVFNGERTLPSSSGGTSSAPALVFAGPTGHCSVRKGWCAPYVSRSGGGSAGGL